MGVSKHGANSGSRTRAICLEGRGATVTLYSHFVTLWQYYHIVFGNISIIRIFGQVSQVFFKRKIRILC